MGQLTATKWQMTAQRSNIAGICVCVTAPNLVETRSLQRVISRLQVGVASSALFERRTTMSGIFSASTRAQEEQMVWLVSWKVLHQLHACDPEHLQHWRRPVPLILLYLYLLTVMCM